MALTDQMFSYPALSLSALFCTFVSQSIPCVFPILHKYAENINKQSVTYNICSQRGKTKQKRGHDKWGQKVETADSEPWLSHLRSTPAVTESVTEIPLRRTSDNPLYIDFFCYVWECLLTNKPSKPSNSAFRAYLLSLLSFLLLLCLVLSRQKLSISCEGLQPSSSLHFNPLLGL